MAFSKNFMKKVQHIAEKNGCTVTRSKTNGGALKIKGPNGGMIVVHGSPSRPEVYKLSLRDEFRKRLGIIIDEKF